MATAKKALAKKAPVKKAVAKSAPASATSSTMSSAGPSTVQYRVVVGKGDERTEGPDDAGTIFVCGVADATLDPTVAYMQGKLKATGHTGVILEQLWSGAAAGAISRLASRP